MFDFFPFFWKYDCNFHFGKCVSKYTHLKEKSKISFKMAKFQPFWEIKIKEIA